MPSIVWLAATSIILVIGSSTVAHAIIIIIIIIIHHAKLRSLQTCSSLLAALIKVLDVSS